LSDEEATAVLTRLVKQRNDSAKQYGEAGREDLQAKELAEVAVIQGYLPEPLSDAEVDAIIAKAIAEAGATSMREMGRVMGIVKGKVAGRADMGKVSATIKARLS